MVRWKSTLTMQTTPLSLPLTAYHCLLWRDPLLLGPAPAGHIQMQRPGRQPSGAHDMCRVALCHALPRAKTSVPAALATVPGQGSPCLAKQLAKWAPRDLADDSLGIPAGTQAPTQAIGLVPEAG